MFCPDLVNAKRNRAYFCSVSMTEGVHSPLNAIPSIQTSPEPKPFNKLMKLNELSASVYLCVYKPMKCCDCYTV